MTLKIIKIIIALVGILMGDFVRASDDDFSQDLQTMFNDKKMLRHMILIQQPEDFELIAQQSAKSLDTKHQDEMDSLNKALDSLNQEKSALDRKVKSIESRFFDLMDRVKNIEKVLVNNTEKSRINREIESFEKIKKESSPVGSFCIPHSVALISSLSLGVSLFFLTNGNSSSLIMPALSYTVMRLFLY